MPKVSVIICTYNRRDKLLSALSGYLNQTFRDFEVIVSSDGSSDGTTEMVEDFRGRAWFPLHYLWQEDLGFRKARAANHAIAVAKGDILIFADDDMVPPVGYIDGYLREFRRHEGAELLVYSKYLRVRSGDPNFTPENIVSGKYMRRLTPLARLHLFLWSLKYRRYIARRNPRRPKLNGGNFAVTAGAIRAVNGLDLDFSGWGYEDDDLRRRLLAHGVTPTEAVSRAFCFNLGCEACDKSTNGHPEMLGKAAANRAMAHDTSRPSFCRNGLNADEEFGQRF